MNLLSTIVLFVVDWLRLDVVALLALLALGVALLVARLAWIQVGEHEIWAEEADRLLEEIRNVNPLLSIEGLLPRF